MAFGVGSGVFGSLETPGHEGREKAGVDTIVDCFMSVLMSVDGKFISHVSRQTCYQRSEAFGLWI